MKKYLFFLLCTLFSVASYLKAQTVLPISEGINPLGSHPGLFIKLRDHLYLFRAESIDYGGEPYVTNGTQAGTFLLKDINAGNASSGSNPDPWFYRVNDTLCLFASNDGDTNHGIELWRSNGTTAGTYMVADLTPGSSSSYIVFSKPVLNNQIFFTITANQIGTLYITDGTAAGTIPLLTGINYPNITSQIEGVANGIAYFNVAVGLYNDLHLWRTDGTVPGTYELTDLNIHSVSLSFAGSLGNDFLFSASDSIHGEELWKTDGTISGTTMIKDLNPGTSSSYSNEPHLLGNKIIFLANPTDATTAVWATDGTSAGTYQLGDSNVLNTCWIEGRAGSYIYFGTTDSYSNILWKTDGTISGTLPIHTFTCGACKFSSGTNADTFAEAYGLKFFVVEDHQYNTMLSSIWATDGTDLGTYQVYASPDTELIPPISQLMGVCGEIYVHVITGNFGGSNHLWRVDQDSAYNLDLFPNYYDPYIWLVDDGSIFFSALTFDSAGAGDELYQLQVCSATTVQNISSANSLTLFPNPNDGAFTVQLPNSLIDAEVRVNDMMGKSVYSVKVDFSADGKLNLQLQNIPAGVYLLQIISDEGPYQQIFIKQ